MEFRYIRNTKFKPEKDWKNFPRDFRQYVSKQVLESTQISEFRQYYLFYGKRKEHFYKIPSWRVRRIQHTLTRKRKHTFQKIGEKYRKNYI